MRFSVVTHGCKLNQFESSSIASKLVKLGLEYVEDFKQADIVIFNTCTVTDNADRKAIKLIKQVDKLKKVRNDIVFVVTGCFAQTDRERIVKFSGVDLVIDNRLKHKIPEVIEFYINNGYFSFEKFKINKGSRFEFDPDSFLGRTRAFLKIQDGCNRLCSFCKVPFSRGGSISLEYEEVIRRFRKLVDLGYKEIVITGVNITNYYSNGYTLKDLLKEMSNVRGEFRIRLSSIMPDEFDVGILEFVSYGKVVPHLHISLQSGSDRIIKLMRRNYTSYDILRLSDTARKYYDDFGLTGDVIVGFPGETDDDFSQTIDTVKKAGFFRLHIFPFSPRKGTLASLMPEQVPYEVKKDREKMLANVVRDLSVEFKKKFLYKKVRIIPEEAWDGGVYGYSDNYLRVFYRTKDFRKNEFCYVEVTDINESDPTTVIAS
ncbi:MAG: tRNA (N(6)-L-threonylcarbamoyladenosine(37)-C(2))-methylthiotransferase MtaB [Brevinematia bacterium]